MQTKLARLLALCCAAGLFAPGIASSQSTCTNAPAGLVGWWKAENNAVDTLGNLNGSLQDGLGFGSGKVGQAFNYTAAGQEVFVYGGGTLNVGTGGGYTTEGWINPLNVATQNPIFEWNDGVTAGAHLWIAVSFAGLGGPGSLYASLIAGTTNTTVATGPGVISAGVWQHVAFTYDRASGMGRLYLNGTEVASRAVGNITAQTALPLRIGRRPNYGAETFTGKIDELSLYDRALSSAELQAVYNAGSAGKCPPLPKLFASSVAWGDYDNDGRLDLLLTGWNGGPISQLWHNDGDGRFTQLPVPGLPGVEDSSVAWGDYDNDGRLDFLLTGLTDSRTGRVSQLWRNSGSGTFIQVPVLGLPGVGHGSVAWSDYDNDGRLDFLLTGSTNDFPGGISGTPVSQLWHNDGNGTFTQKPVLGLPGVKNSSVAWGDYDNDGRRDLLLTGFSGDAGYISQLWHININGVFTQIPVSGLPGVAFGSVAWADYDNDGRLDFLLTGSISGAVVSQLWHNNSNGTFSNVTGVAAPGMPGVGKGSVAWGDYDSDGWLDFLLSGRDRVGLTISQLWHNNGNGTFSNTTSVAAPGLPGVEYGSVAWGDYDNDGQLDLLLTGYNGTNNVSRLWHNQVVTTSTSPGDNTSPGPPGGLTMVITNDGVILNWSAASDAQTPAAGLTYNLRMGTTPGGSDLVSPHAAANGFHRLPAMGNRQQTRSAKQISLPLNQTVYWSVQAVDTAFAGSAFAPEKTFKVFAVIAPVTASAVVPGDVNSDGVVDQSELNAVLTNYWPSSPWLQMTEPVKLPNGLFQFALTNASAWLFSVEVTTNFNTWAPLGLAYPVYQFHDPPSTNSPMRYYRLRWP